jgi:hypothetical protein
MFKRFLLGGACLLAALTAPTATAGENLDVPALLKKADAYRLDEQPMRVETQVELFRDGKLDKERLYTVYSKPGRRSLVLMKSPLEAGQKVLLLGDQFWLLMPDSQRPLRISASQKLLGEAATGDIATMTWSEDYQGQLAGETEIQGKRCLLLELDAARNGVTYRHIALYLERGSALPVKADLYVDSGKRAKEAWFEGGKLDGRQRIVSMTLLDDIQHNRKTVIRYRSIVPKALPDEFFNPAALIHNALSEW